MSQIKNIFWAMGQGFKDSITGTAVVFYLDNEVNKRMQLHSPEAEPIHPQHSAKSSSFRRQDAVKAPEKSNVRMRVFNCCVLNGGVFLASIFMFEWGLLPALSLLLRWVFGPNSGNAAYVWSWIQPFLSLLFGMIWVMPLLILSRVVNSLWFQDIANSAYKFRKGRPKPIAISKFIADTLFSMVVQFLFLVQSMVVQQFPMKYVGELLCLVHMCLLYSLYAFEYKWFNMGWELHKRLTYIERDWPYFMGFGLPLAVLTNLAQSNIVNGCIFAILFPFFILSANESTPADNVCNIPLKLFSPVVVIANAAFSKTVDPNPVQSTPQPTGRSTNFASSRYTPPTLTSTPTRQRLVNSSGAEFSPLSAQSSTAPRHSSAHRSTPSSSSSHRSSPTASQRPTSTAAAPNSRGPLASFSGFATGLPTHRGSR